MTTRKDLIKFIDKIGNLSSMYKNGINIYVDDKCKVVNVKGYRIIKI